MSDAQTHLRLIPALLWRWLLTILLWWILAEGSVAGTGFALAFGLLAALSSLPLLPPQGRRDRGPRLLGWLRFIPFFLWQSLLGGIDVARRAFHPRLPLAPQLIEFRTTLPAGWPRVLFLNTLSLLPGTLAVTQRGDSLRIHLLDGRGDPLAALRQVETRVSALFIDRRKEAEAQRR